MQTISSTEFVRNARTVLDSLPLQGEVVIERHGVGVAKLIAVQEAVNTREIFARHSRKNVETDDAFYADSARMNDVPVDPWSK
jgi:antitoxin (DNA-binding transcriptional repressor) of toxin-antitoxin stability system